MTTPTSHHEPRRRKQPIPKARASESVAPAAADSPANPPASFIEPDRRHGMISDAAYFLSEQRDFCPGHELEDWLTAEREVDRALGSGEPGTGCGT